MQNRIPRKISIQRDQPWLILYFKETWQILHKSEFWNNVWRSYDKVETLKKILNSKESCDSVQRERERSITHYFDVNLSQWNPLPSPWPTASTRIVLSGTPIMSSLSHNDSIIFETGDGGVVEVFLQPLDMMVTGTRWRFLQTGRLSWVKHGWGVKLWDMKGGVNVHHDLSFCPSSNIGLKWEVKENTWRLRQK